MLTARIVTLTPAPLTTDYSLPISPMPLIRHANARNIARDAIVLDLGDLQRQAAAIVADAQARALAIAAAARDERARILAGAAEQGRAEGLEAGQKAGHTAGHEAGRAQAIDQFEVRLSEIETNWNAALTDFQSRRDHLLRSAQLDVLRLAIRIAERITKRIIATDPLVAASQLEAVLAVIVRPTELIARIHPDDRPVLTEALPQLAARFSQVRHIELIDDPSLSRGSCIATTRSIATGSATDALSPGQIDASIDTQLDRILEALLPADSTAPTPASPPGSP